MALLLALALELASAHPAVRSRTIEDLANDLNDLPRAVDEVATHLDAQMQDIAEHLAEARLILFTGAGPHFAAAAFGAAKTKELSPIHAYAQPLEEYHHYRSQKAADPLFLVAPDQTSRERALDTALVSHTIGGNTVALVPESEQEIPLYVPYTVRLPIIRDELSPILYSVPLHLFAYHFSMARFKRNLGYPSALGSTRDSRADVL
jgi:glucosamine--fructose-6-phosphate aminotransferase (isomerizing)